MRIRTLFAALALASAGLFGAAGTAAADINFAVGYTPLTVCGKGEVNTFSVPIDVASPETFICGNTLVGA